MKNNLLSTATFVGLLLALSTPASAGEHGPIRPYLDAHGHAMRGLRNTYTTGNWSGYAIGSWQSGQSYASASMTWQVPAVSYVAGISSVDYLASWVGIGGFCQNADCTTVDQTLIQLGTGAQVSVTGQVVYYPWYELLPAAETPLPYVVKPGDEMSASLSCASNCSSGQKQTWTLTMSDLTAGWTWPATNFQYQSGMSSVDAITEAPYSSGILPLAGYTGGNFDPVLANGVEPGLTLAANGIIMSDPSGGSSTPSSIPSGNQFSTCYGTGSCAATPIGSSPPPAPQPPPKAPVASLTANPTSVNLGQESRLTWSSINATACAGTQFSAAGTAGATEVLPLATRTYIITCSAPGEPAASASATVTVKRMLF
jgi:Peptidase A4 family